MADSTLTTTVTFDDLIAHYGDELQELRDAYDDVLDRIRDDFGEAGIDAAVPQDAADEEDARLGSLQQTANLYSESAKSIQKRQHVLERLRADYSSDTFELKMLSGSELADIETELRMEAQRRDVAVEALQAERQRRVADAATVDAPPEVCDDDGTPVVSEAPNPLTLSIYEMAEQLNQQGGLDFSPPGFGDPIGTGARSSASPRTSGSPLSASSSTDESTPPTGDDSKPS